MPRTGQTLQNFCARVLISQRSCPTQTHFPQSRLGELFCEQEERAQSSGKRSTCLQPAH